MSVVSTLIHYNIPFRFENLNAVVEQVYANQLIKNFIPFKFKDGKLFLVEPLNSSVKNNAKKDALIDMKRVPCETGLFATYKEQIEILNRPFIERQMGILARTIGEVLAKSQKFTLTQVMALQNETPIDGKCSQSIKIMYCGQLCMIEVYTDKLLLKYGNYGSITYDKWTLTLNFKSALQNTIYLLQKLKDGFVMMVIAGFTHQITPLNWTSFTYSNYQNGKSCTIRYVNDTEPYFLAGQFGNIKFKNLDSIIQHYQVFLDIVK